MRLPVFSRLCHCLCHCLCHPFHYLLWLLPLTCSTTLFAQTTAPRFDTSTVPELRTASPLPSGWQHGAFMEIFVRAFKDSNGDGIGDLRGLTRSLPYLQRLGIRGIWLMPITPSADGDHGYATTDFRAIAPEYGTLADFDELIKQAHRRGIGVVMDYVINHSAASHPAFVAARQGPAAPFRDWFVWADAAPAGWSIWDKYPWYHVAAQPWQWQGEVKDMPLAAAGARDFYFGTFGPHMPDFNFNNPAVLAYHLSSLRFWLNRGLDGYRLDAVPHLVENDAVNWNDQPQSRAITKQLQDAITAYPKRYVVCEATAEPQAYGDPAVCGGAFAFGHVHHYVKAAMGEAASVQNVASYYQQARATMATFVSNHDIFAGRRLWDQVGGARDHERRYKLAAAGYLLQPGTPFIYYGEELGQAGVHSLAGDLPLRSPMAWAPDAATGGFTTGKPFRPVAPNVATHNVQTQLSLEAQLPHGATEMEGASLLQFYRAMLGLRNRLPSVAQGSYEGAFAQGLVAGWQRRWGGGEPSGKGGAAAKEHTLVLINYGTSGADVQVPQLPAGARLLPEWPRWLAPTRAGADGTAALRVPAQTVQVWRVVQVVPAVR
jgi:alpha-amylase